MQLKFLQSASGPKLLQDNIIFRPALDSLNADTSLDHVSIRKLKLSLSTL